MRYSFLGISLLASGALAEHFQVPLQQATTTTTTTTYAAKKCAATSKAGIESDDIWPGLTADPMKVQGKHYDYVIAGGGLTGLTIAAKLVDDGQKVLVIESGYYGSEYGPIIDDLNTYGQIFGSSVDHAYETSPQFVGNDGKIGLDKDIKIVRSGNGLGGSTLINGGTWTRPHKSQINSWSQIFGNTEWTWDKLKPYMDAIEDPRDPKTDIITPGSLHNFTPACHNKPNSGGKVKVGARDRDYPWSPVIKALMDTVKKTYPDVKNQKDLCCGDPSGVSMFLNTVNTKQVRTDAARSWLDPVLANQTLAKRITVLTGQLVGKVHLENNSNAKPAVKYKATGVEFGVHNKTQWKWDVWADKEVLLAAGSTISPLILQWSGIGPTAWLQKARIEQKLDLPVGYNLQDQTTTSVVTDVKRPAGDGQGQAAYFATFKEIFGDDAKKFEDMLRQDENLKTWAQKTVQKGGFPKDHEKDLLEQYKNYRTWLLDDKVSYAELFLDTDNRTRFDLWTLIPFTRGYVKALDSDPYLRSFEYNPRYFENELDLNGQAAATRLARNLTNSYDMKDFAAEELVPGEYVSKNAKLEEWATYVKQNFRANYHGVGTCSMMKKELGGVVDQKAKVYDVDGLRVVDGSIPPTQVSSHVMTVFYAMASKIADAVIAAAHKGEKSTCS